MLPGAPPESPAPSLPNNDSPLTGADKLIGKAKEGGRRKGGRWGGVKMRQVFYLKG